MYVLTLGLCRWTTDNTMESHRDATPPPLSDTH